MPYNRTCFGTLCIKAVYPLPLGTVQGVYSLYDQLSDIDAVYSSGSRLGKSGVSINDSKPDYGPSDGVTGD